MARNVTNLLKVKEKDIHAELLITLHNKVIGQKIKLPFWQTIQMF